MPEYYIGLMSGTSVDAVDSVLIDFDNNKGSLVQHRNHPIPEPLKEKIHTVCSQGKQATLHDCATLDIELGGLFADAVKQLLEQSGLMPSDIQAVASHGQTVFHHPDGLPAYSVQLGDANIIAEKTGITTVADFRRRDMAAGGQGAPLVPAFHQHAFQVAHENRVILNLGGIANITILPADSHHQVSGFDTGPGNTLLDQWALKYLNQAMDINGDFAASGICNEELLRQLLSDDYFSRPAPKSTGREYFNLKWLHKNLGLEKYNAEDIQATLAELTIKSISMAIQSAAADTNHVFVCGGGSHNPVLMNGLQRTLGLPVDDTSACGIHPDWVEAMAFAWMAKRTLARQSSNLPTVTGARSETILGAVYLVRQN